MRNWSVGSSQWAVGSGQQPNRYRFRDVGYATHVFDLALRPGTEVPG